MTVATGTLTGTLQDPTGAPLVGAKITAAPQVRGSILAHGVVVTAGPVPATTDATGHFSLTLTATDDPATTPTGFTYRITITPPAGSQQWFDPFSISVPTGMTIDLSTVVPTSSSGGSPSTITPQAIGIDSTGTPYLLNTAVQDTTTQPDSKRLVTVGKIGPAVSPIITGPLAASAVTQGLYARTQPLPDGGVASIRPLIGAGGDPAASGRVWAIGSRFGQIGYTDDHGASFTAKAVAGSQGVQQAIIANGYMWVLTAAGAHTGQLYRSPAPAADGSGLSFTLMFDIAAPPTGITTGDNANFRNSCVAVNGANVYLVEYSTTTITGGPSCYYSADSGATWSKVKTWANGKHCHAVKVIGGVPWVSVGDGGTSFTDIGLWNATAAGATTWNQRSLYGEATGGNTYYPINFFPLNVGGQPMIVGEYDGSRNYGPLLFGSQSTTVTKALIPLCQMPGAYLGTMRQLTSTPEGNLMWVQTGEGGAVGPLDSIVIAKGPHFTAPVVLESFAASNNTLGTLGDPIVDGSYVWFGTYRITREKFTGQ